MASWTQKCLSCVITHIHCSRNFSKVCRLSTCAVAVSNKTCKVDIGVMHDGKAVVCFHPATDTAFALTKPIPRHDLIGDTAETHNLMLKSRLTAENVKNKPDATIEELSKMFYTTKHRWYPVGEYHTRRRKRNPPTDR
ncbi:39S ribosomal protein L42, mitochondrial [Astyanax mexicanus]|uniref:Large ribosomal subunit protein mL42 n=1 Tax=Astyanax mexicanus TaxID=7994 RepID=A0A8T2M821_ASTMX|nr:39S ribosomal protein L42, mitochondrial [Astyanax mexicanus]